MLLVNSGLKTVCGLLGLGSGLPFLAIKRPLPCACDLEWFERRIGPILPSCDDLKIPPICGPTRSVGLGGEGERFFFIGHYVNQRLGAVFRAITPYTYIGVVVSRTG